MQAISFKRVEISKDVVVQADTFHLVDRKVVEVRNQDIKQHFIVMGIHDIPGISKGYSGGLDSLVL